jgi:LytS/YehU family sensor histidine kinase
VQAARRADGWIALTVSNTGAAYAPPSRVGPDGRTPTGLDNTRARLELMYGAASRLEITGGEWQATRVSFAVSGRRVDE